MQALHAWPTHGLGCLGGAKVAPSGRGREPGSEVEDTVDSEPPAARFTTHEFPR
jgi:hypothetical protein